jgi:hypothetical protein
MTRCQLLLYCKVIHASAHIPPRSLLAIARLFLGHRISELTARALVLGELPTIVSLHCFPRHIIANERQLINHVKSRT